MYDNLIRLITEGLAKGVAVTALVRDDDGHGTDVTHNVKSYNGEHYVGCYWLAHIDRYRGLSEIDKLFIDGGLVYVSSAESERIWAAA